ncbi:hypothetical protein [Acidisphaera sp. S103]|uniref:hypothetical protein n=1 Tax=Acidisphaera sp. S103 TaxID=1747223 RepID=UPI00131B1DD9|nr:hypothetical protein [Acidisphaera sp. S103]
MFRKPFGWTIALAGLTAAVLAGFSVLAATGPTDPPGQPAEACAKSTGSFKQLAMIDNETDGSFQCLGVLLDGGAIKAIRVETHRFASAARRKETEQVKVEEFSQAVIESSRGAVLDGVPGHDAIILRGHFSDASDRLQLVTTFLYNGFTSEYRSCQMTLDHTPGAGWHLVNGRDQTISHIMVKTREIPLIGTFGIANLEGACT